MRIVYQNKKHSPSNFWNYMNDPELSSYQIPSTESSGSFLLWLPFLLFIASASTAVVTGSDAILLIGGILTIVLTSFIMIAKSSRYVARRNSIWKSHDYDWYRHAFPSQSGTHGRLSCRYCGSTHLQAKNLMNRTYTRLHSCGQCGKTLYFSAEQM